jgi:mannose-6-phosphate isomerase-like protein (cupin superfamily)
MNLPALASTLALTGVMLMSTTGEAQTPGVTHTSAPDVNALFAKPGGGTVNDDVRYKVMVSTRTGAGEAEQHARDTDIFYIVEGSATFATGGAIVGAHETGPNETRGTGLSGAVEQTLSAGDVVTIDAGVPHWFKAVDGRVKYFVVKVKR